MKAKIPSRIQIAATILIDDPAECGVAPQANKDNVINSLSDDFARDGLNVDDILTKPGSGKVEFLVSWTLPMSFKGFKIVNLEAMKGRG